MWPISRLQPGPERILIVKILALTYDEFLKTLQARYNKGEFHASRIYRKIFQNRYPFGVDLLDFPDSPEIVHTIVADIDFHPGKVVDIQTEGELTKFITRLPDGHEIESVIIPMATHNTICVSSQVGCRMGCRFCQTGQMGFSRNLTAEEIVGQIYAAKFKLHREIRNVVFMGMGEPLDNLENVLQAVRVLNDQRGLNIALRYITVSTVGTQAGIERFAALSMPGLRLSISLNAPNDQVRFRLMPGPQIASMQNLQDALIHYPFSRKETVFITYVLIKGVNDRHEHALQLAEFARPLPSKINVIPYNPRTASPFEAPSPAGVEQFSDWLVSCGVFIRRRGTKGQGVMAACGQLGKILPS